MESRYGRSRRGGSGDAGGTSGGSGGLPEATPVSVGSEAELHTELRRVVAQLASGVEWTLRVDALLRLEGLLKGGAANWAAFPDLLMGLRDALAAQMQERRSAVSRQVLHVVAALAATCGSEFEPLAVHLLPIIFKTLAMGINVVTDSADACAYSLLCHCPSPRLLPKLLTTLNGADRNGRLRQSAADYLLCALEAWEPHEYERQLESVEKAVLAAAGDAQAETRATGRALYAAYARAWPAQAAALLVRLGRTDRGLQEKLAAAAAEYLPGMSQGMLASLPPSRRTSLGNSGASTPRGGLPRTSSLPTAAAQHGGGGGGAVRLTAVVPKLVLSAMSSAAGSARGSPSHPTSARSASTRGSGGLGSQHTATAAGLQQGTARENQPDNRAAAAATVQATPRSMFSKAMPRRDVVVDADGEAADPDRHPAAAGGGMERLAPRRSLGGAALRMGLAPFRRELIEECDEAAAQQAAAASQRAAALQRVTMRAPQLPLPQQVQEQQQEPAQPPAPAGPLTARRLGAQDWQPSSIPEDSETSSLSSGWEELGGTCAPAASLGPLLAGLGKAGIGWADKVSTFQSVQAVLQQSGSSPHLTADISSHTDRLVAALLEGAGDAHFRVAAAALAALGAGLASPCSRLFEAQLDRVMTALFARVVDPKEQIRRLVCAALSAVLQQQSSDATVAALARSLQANRAPKVKCAVMEFFSAAVTAAALGNEAGTAQQAPAGAAAGPSQLLAQLSGTVLPGLLRSLLHLATDKNPDIRRAAADAVASVYHGGEAQAVLAAVHSLPPADLLAVQRSIGPAIQQRAAANGGSGGSGGGEVAVAQPSRTSSRAGASAAVSHAGSRRHSGEGSRQQQAGGAQQPQQVQQRAESSGSLTARGRLGSQQAEAAAPAPALASPVHQQQQQQHTPEPPSPFAWRERSASPTGSQPGEPGTTAAAGAAAPGAVAAAAHAPVPQLAGSAAPLAPPSDQQAALRVSDLAPFDDVMAGQLARLLAQLEQGPTCDTLQSLSRLAHVLPAAAWPPCFDQILDALCAALDSSSTVLRDAGLILARDLAAAAQPSLFLPALPALLPRLLACAAEQEAREVAVAADEALEALLSRTPPQSCLGLLAPQLPRAGEQLSTDRLTGALLHAAIRSLQRVVARMQPAGLGAHLQPLLAPGLCAAYGSPLADVRKATVDCLVAIWQVVGDALRPHLHPLSASQMRLLEIYMQKARKAPAAARASAA